MDAIIIRYKKVEKTWKGMDFGVRVLPFNTPEEAKERFDYFADCFMKLNHGKVEGRCYEDNLLYMWVEEIEAA